MLRKFNKSEKKLLRAVQADNGYFLTEKFLQNYDLKTFNFIN